MRFFAKTKKKTQTKTKTKTKTKTRWNPSEFCTVYYVLFLFSLSLDHRQGSHDLGEDGVVRGKLADTSIFDSRFFHIS